MCNSAQAAAALRHALKCPAPPPPPSLMVSQRAARCNTTVCVRSTAATAPQATTLLREPTLM